MTFEIYTWLTGLFLVFSTVLAYVRSRDPLHPLMYLAPLFMYVHVFTPAYLYRQGLLEHHYPGDGQLAFAQGIVCVGVGLFCLGCLAWRVPRRARVLVNRPFDLGPARRRRVRMLSFVLAGVGLLSYAVGLSQRGGFLAAYSSIKGGGWSPSGYISEAPLLTLPAILLYLLSKSPVRLNLKTASVVLLFAAPHLLQGLLGARRGPAFIGLTALGFGYYLARRRRPSVRAVVAGVGAVGLLMLFLVSQRKQIYIGSAFDFDANSFKEAVAPTSINAGNTTLMSWDAMLVADHHDRHYWGRRYGVQLLVRPIPKQLWPSKYESTGMEWMVSEPGSMGFTSYEWQAAVGRLPVRGSAIGCVGDAFIEFGWAGLLLVMAVGGFYGYLWRRSVLYGEFWSVLYLEAAVVSVYIPTQGLVSAWLYRFLFLAIPSWLLWKGTVVPLRARKRRLVAHPG